MLHRVYDLCAAHCSPRDADSGRIVVHRYYSASLLPLASTLNEQKLSTFSESVPTRGEHKSRSRKFT